MSPEQQAAYVHAQAVAALGDLLGMFVHDMCELKNGGTGVYTEESYQKVANTYGIHHNQVLTLFRGL